MAVIQAPGAYAYKCEAESPRHKEQQEAYFELDDHVVLTAEQRDTMNKLFESLLGEWVGGVEDIICVPTGDSAKPYTNRGKATAEIQVAATGFLHIQVDKKYRDGPDETTSTIEILQLFGDDIIFELKVSKDSIYAVEKHRAKNVQRGSRLVESEITLTVNGRSLTIEISSFTNGYLVGKQKLNLKRK